MVHALAVKGMTPQQRDEFDDGLEEAGLRLIDNPMLQQARLVELEAEKRRKQEAEMERMRATWGLEPDDIAGMRAMEAMVPGGR